MVSTSATQKQSKIRSNLFYAMLCYAMLCHAMLCYADLTRATHSGIDKRNAEVQAQSKAWLLTFEQGDSEMQRSLVLDMHRHYYI